MTDFETSGWEATEKVIAAEMAIAGAAIQSRLLLDEAADIVTPADFYSVARYVFAAALEVRDNCKPADRAKTRIDTTEVLIQLQNQGDLERVGGGSYLHTLMEHAAVAGSVGRLCKEISQDAERRRLQQALRTSIQMTEHATWDPSTDIDQVRKMVDEALTRRIGERPKDVSATVVKLLDELENPPPKLDVIETPFEDLNHLLGGGFRKGQLVVIAGRPGLGKSVLSVDFARKAAIQNGERSIIFTLEMSEEEVVDRITAAEGRIPLRAIRTRNVTRQQLAAAAEAGARISGSPLTIDFVPGCTLDHIRSQLRWLSREDPAKLVVVDYLQIMTAPKNPRRDIELGMVTQQLKAMAGEFGLTIVLLSQLNRESQKRTDKRPQIGELKDSGSIEADADVVILIHREDAYEPESPRAGEAELIVAKNRGGPQATVTVAAQLHYSRLIDMAKDEPTSTPTGRPDLHVVN
ncbi:AAA family ATPase [Nonomuraea phyllanthi]|uniref:DNA 5'-3' helicase n=1 Tax=Nonomuraea phyllanthi TaxID=2219224 RepID=A0A5C4V7D9_9ACTN|nr:DnaB-like helicase C-terminal domain-containing protein [Nonomuraea phyllanthi]KAB8186925.1 AAA family ATPase [Nonomuraea phyllanthi]